MSLLLATIFMLIIMIGGSAGMHLDNSVILTCISIILAGGLAGLDS